MTDILLEPDLSEQLWIDYIEAREREAQIHDEAVARAFWRFKDPDRLI